MRCSIIADACDAVVVGFLSVEQLRRLADRERAPDGLERQLHDARGSPRSSSTLTGRLTRRTASIPIVVHYLKQRLLQRPPPQCGSCVRSGHPMSSYSPTNSVQYFLPDGEVAEARPYRVRLGISMFVRCPDDLTHCCMTQVVSLQP